jgi:hypothetical protein
MVVSIGRFIIGYRLQAPSFIGQNGSMQKNARTKCAKEGCNAPIGHANAKYCSRTHAPFAHLLKGYTHTRSGQTEKSFSADYGETSRAPSIEEPNLEPDTKTSKMIPITKRKKEKTSEIPIGETSKKLDEKTTTDSSLTDKENRSSCEKTANTDTEKTQMQTHKYGNSMQTNTEKTTTPNTARSISELPTSINTLDNTSSDKSPSTSLIDSSAQHLFDLMKSLEKNKSSTRVETVKAACECAKGIQSLIRLKLDMYRESRRVR